MKYSVYFDSPDLYPGKFNFYEEGGSPELLKNLINIIDSNKDQLVEINLSWYLFNNNILHEFLKNLPQHIIINVITIPLEGYDNSKPKRLKKLGSDIISDSLYSKYDLARKIFNDRYNSESNPNYNIYFFPHIYVRSPYVKPFSRGRLPYSLHIKSLYLKLKGERSIIGLSSSNLAVRDLVKFESLITIENNETYSQSFKSFFDDLIKNSIHIKKFNKSLNIKLSDYTYSQNNSNEYSFFSAPFYLNSANLMEEELTRIISNAKEKIIICAQHLAAFDYSVNSEYSSSNSEVQNRLGILGSILRKGKEGVKITCISQTFSPPNEDHQKFKNQDFRSPINSKNFEKFYSNLKHIKNADYFVNQDVHLKFLIIDDILIFCTYNFTPTQFIYLDKVKIDKFINMNDISFSGVHCEVSSHLVIKDLQTTKSFLKFADSIIKSNNTIKVL
jgi:hypothetical protein